jgi:hypothetical protein
MHVARGACYLRGRGEETLSAPSLRDLACDDTASIDAVAAYLENLPHAERVAQSRTLRRDEQRKLYEKAKAAAPLTLDDFAPPAKGARTQVIHHGRNTLPLPGNLRNFQKRMSRPATAANGNGATRLFGYNASPFESTVGPGFFLAVPTAGRPEWEARGAIVVDYFQIPDGPVPDGWPKVIPNTQGLQRFVYNRTRDFMRRVSKHVTIGAAYKEEKALDHYFVLVRED